MKDWIIVILVVSFFGFGLYMTLTSGGSSRDDSYCENSYEC